jgi:toxin ParE1/3/4
LAEIRFRALAVSDLAAIRLYSVAEFGRDVALRYLDEFDAAWRLLADHPRIGSAYASRSKRAIRSLPCGSHRIYYWVDGKRIWIIRVLHSAMDQNRILHLIG